LKIRNIYLNSFLMRISAFSVSKFTFSHRMINTRLASHIVRVLTFVTKGTKILIVKFFAYIFRRCRLDDFSLHRMRIKTVETIFTVSHVKVVARVITFLDVSFVTNVLSATFRVWKILVRAHLLDSFKLRL